MSLTQTELESYLWGAATVLRGTIDAGDYKQFIFPLLFFKRISDVWAEEYQRALEESDGDVDYASFAENHRFQIPEGAHWSDVREVTTNVGQALQSAMRVMEQANPDKLYGVFGDAQWTNKDRLSDETLRDLIEHFSQRTLSTEHVPDDQFGQAYEYLIKRFADDSGHTAQEFYTNRTLVHLMTLILDPKPGESVYDPTCGTGGMLLSAAVELKRQGKEHRNLKLYGQELNLMSSSIARMNLFLHGIVDFEIERGNTLSEPKFLEGDRLQQFDVVLANPPYSIKQWDRTLWAADPYGRNRFGTPPQGRADYAFFQHILASMSPGGGRCAILFPHGVLFRDDEREMRKRVIEADLIDCVLGLGPGLFYNSPMEACVLFCRTDKPAEREGKVLFINAVDELVRRRASVHLSDENIARIAKWYRDGADVPGVARLVPTDALRSNDYTLSIPVYVSSEARRGQEEDNVHATPEAWQASGVSMRAAVDALGSSIGMEPTATPSREHASDPRPRVHPDEWRLVRFDQLVQNVTERVDDPRSAGVKRYVGLEHLDPDELHIKRWGSPEDVEATKLRFTSGDVIFGRRRAYQRKLSQATFEGICSAHAMVLRAKHDEVLPEFLPFLLQTDGFFDLARRISVGSLSPTVNWKALARQELVVPPLQRQREIAALLDKAYELGVRESDVARAVAAVRAGILKEALDAAEAQRTCADVVKLARAGGTPSRGRDDYFGGDIPWLKSGGVLGDAISTTEETLTPEGLASSSAWLVPAGAVVVAMYGAGTTRGQVGALAKPMATNQAVLALIADDAVADQRFLYHWLSSRTNAMRSRAAGAVQPNLSKKLVLEEPFPSAGVDQQRELARTLDAALAAEKAIAERVVSTKATYARLREELLAPGGAAQHVH